jgi:dTDP-4-dehydrorhamnose reductase
MEKLETSENNLFHQQEWKEWNPLPLTSAHTFKRRLKILVTWWKWMLAYDFSRTQKDKYDIILVDREECDITSFESVMQSIAIHQPDVLLNCAAYTAVDDAEDIGMKICFDVNTLGVKNLAKATSVFGVEFITISTDYVFDGNKSEWYLPTDECNPINIYGMSKYLGEKLALDENPRTIIVRTSWLYGWEVWGMRYEVLDQNQEPRTKNQEPRTKNQEPRTKNQEPVFKNFVNTMLRLSETRSELRVVADQHGIPTSCIDLSFALAEIIDCLEAREYAGHIFHLSNSCSESTKNDIRKTHSVTWADFAREIFVLTGRDIRVTDCTSDEYPTKARRPEWSVLKNESEILFPHWKIGLARYLGK